MDSIWWAIALSEEVTGKKPLSVDIGDRPVVLWRDLKDQVRALEDRCPHRRAPLSLGCIRKEGWIQCGYHGWSYDGETGRVMEIPNLKNEQRFGPVYKAERFAVHESAGFVHVSLNLDAPAPPLAELRMPLSGVAHVALNHERYLAALLDDPGLVLSIFGVHFTTYLMSELHEENGRLVMERSCQWKLAHWPAAFSSDYPLTLVASIEPASGETALLLRDARFQRALVDAPRTGTGESRSDGRAMARRAGRGPLKGGGACSGVVESHQGPYRHRRGRPAQTQADCVDRFRGAAPRAPPLTRAKRCLGNGDRPCPIPLPYPPRKLSHRYLRPRSQKSRAQPYPPIAGRRTVSCSSTPGFLLHTPTQLASGPCAVRSTRTPISSGARKARSSPQSFTRAKKCLDPRAS